MNGRTRVSTDGTPVAVPVGEPSVAGAAPTQALSERLGPYRLVQQIGEGGMGVVHLALDPHGRAVAIKVLRPGIAHDEQARARLEREVATLSRVRHPRVAPVIQADLSGPRPYVVTRYIAGDPLDDAIAARGPLHGPALLRLARGLLGALEAIHAVGVVHRDLKPGNVLIDDDGGPVVIDFGIAHVADDSRLTSTGMVMGTPGYLAPEIIEGAEVTPATDWWGWAATLAFAATGRPPFGRGSMDIVLTRVRTGNCDLAGIDPRLEPLLAAALSPYPQDRPTVGAVMAGLERYAAGGLAADVLPPRQEAPRHTLVMPTAPPSQPAPFAGPLRTPAAPAAYAVPVPPPPAASGQVAPVAASAWAEDVERADPRGPGAPDPRIGRADRHGTLLALGAVLVALAAAAPGIALLALAVWSGLARTVDRSVTARVWRRFIHGHRRSDLPVAVGMAPLHVLGGLAAAVMGLVLPVLLGIATVVSVVFGFSAGTGSAPTAALSGGLACGLATTLAMAWWGPGGASLRRGSKSLVRGLVPSGLVSQIVVALLLAGAAVALGWAGARGWAPLWWPLTGAPSFLR